ncbi:putative serine/threonine-protein phosphatase 4 regulatory subunit [Phytophthora cinnamomi]|uniref:putative serine/threonine-protein phosphatase 4 regulatory subunit n=1 Tax=Phytophthora cinnamomi TaxID=4785 RepID=UPI003559A733|nr:putative serine/threonine-protein phosphatase 4 regulatory subunit [Phytophthora cinnamomi]
MDSDSSIDQLFRGDIAPRDLPPCDVEHLDEILMVLKTSHPTVRGKVLKDLADKDGAYIVKLLDVFDVSELDADKAVLHKLFDIFYAILEMCNRGLMEVLLSESNFISVVGVFGYNPGLIREVDFRTALEGDGGFHEVVPITDHSVVERVHMNFRIQVIKDNVLSRSLPDGCVLLLEHMANENNFHILSYISESEDYLKSIKEFVSIKEKRKDGLGLLKAIINLVRVTKPVDRPQRRDPFGAPPVFGSLIGNLFSDGELFAAFGTALGSPESKPEEVALAVDILNVLVFYQGPDRLRSYLASEGKCIPAPTSDKERITWTEDSSLFTALLIVFERDEPMRSQLFNLLREIFRVPLAHDDKFLSVLYPNYMHWLLQPLKNNNFVHDESAMFGLQDSIMELLTFCTENHGYRVKYLFGRQPIATYAEKMLRSKNKLFVIHAVKFVRACAVRAEAFFSRFLIQNDLFTPMLANLEIGKPNSGAVSSAILEVLAFIEKTNLTSLVEHIYTKFYEMYKGECPLVFEAIRTRHDGNSGPTDAPTDSSDANKVRFVRAGSVDDEEELYFEKETDTTESTPEMDKNSLSEEDVPCQNRPRTVRLVDYDDDDDESMTAAPSREGNPADAELTTSPRGADIAEEERELKLPVRKKKEEEVDTQTFLGGCNLLAQKKANQNKKARSPQFKNVFQKISWKLSTPDNANGVNGSPSNAVTKKSGDNDDGSDAKRDDSDSNSVGGDCKTSDDGTSAESAALLVAKRKLALDEAANSDSLLKKAKTCTPISSS